jgi:SAM-dependent methyltransferase
MFTRSAALYDALYAHKGYADEARRLHALIERHKETRGSALLDVACGTGSHLAFLRQHYSVEGLDLDPVLLDIARRKLPDIPLHQADMVDFELGREFDVVVCLASSIGYARTVLRLRHSVATMGRHLRPGGVLVVEPWLTPDVWVVGHPAALFVDRPELKVARMSVSAVEDGISVLDFHYLVATPAGVEHFTERHEMGLFRHEDYVAAFTDAGLRVAHDPEGLIGRGLYIGVRPSG